MTRWGMVIDLRRCVGCQTCTVACKIEHFVPPGLFFSRVNDYEVGEYPNVARRFLPLGCMHCEHPPCVDVCPTGASSRREDGIVVCDRNVCVGCRYCMVACPYGARQYNDGTQASYFEAGPTPNDAIRVGCHLKGTVVKCTFCADRIDEGIRLGLRPGVDRDATPMCVSSCIAGARYFGDLDNNNSEVARLVRSSISSRLREELGTDPSVYYIRK
ncbi:MAG: 4Fe-4S dicluster domain-containing protein [Candidatus Marsarchaeota archaeon]|nr:4Fe-4S dicluster domain-containing protein [Candidatus Marsarchaeota archaeon]